MPFFVSAENFGYPGELNLENNALRDCVLLYNDLLENNYYEELNPDFIQYFDAHYQRVGFVSSQGHFSISQVPGVTDFLNGLWCSKFLVSTRSDGEPTFYFSNPNNLYSVDGMNFRGSGHVSFNNDSGFSGEALIGFASDTCRVTSAGGSCEINEVCVLKASSDTENAHVASCIQENYPHTNNYQHKICCTPTEYCRDGVDNTGDGLIDCQSPECHASPINMEPQRCDPDPDSVYVELGLGNFQSTSFCVTGYNESDDSTFYNESCLGVSAQDDGWTGYDADTWPDGFPEEFQYDDLKSPYHCSYGVRDDGTFTNNTGYCCPPDTRAVYNPFDDVWFCDPFSECAIRDLSLPDGETDVECGYDHRILGQWPDWLESSFISGSDEWCVSEVGDYFNPINDSIRYQSSMSCCFVAMYGKFGFYHNDENVKIFGYE